MKKKLVTVQNNNGESNVYTLEKEMQDEALLSHPFAPSVYIIKPLRELNIVSAVPKTSYERCLEYVSQNVEDFDIMGREEIECLSTIFVVNRKFPNKFRNILVRLTGVLARIQFRNSMKAAVEFINENKALFDDYHNRVYHSETYYPIFKGKAETTGNKRQTETIFNMAGFLLSQTSTK